MAVLMRAPWEERVAGSGLPGLEVGKSQMQVPKVVSENAAAAFSLCKSCKGKCCRTEKTLVTSEALVEWRLGQDDFIWVRSPESRIFVSETFGCGSFPVRPAALHSLASDVLQHIQLVYPFTKSNRCLKR